MEILMLIKNKQKNMQITQDVTYTKMCYFFPGIEVNLKNKAQDSSSSAKLVLYSTKTKLCLSPSYLYWQISCWRTY